MKELREIIYLIEQAEELDAHEGHDISSPLAEQHEVSVDISERLADLTFKMRAYSEPLNESAQGGYSMGVEAGLEMAAEMLDNLIRELSRSE